MNEQIAVARSMVVERLMPHPPERPACFGDKR
jgi:hypothetical protein